MAVDDKPSPDFVIRLNGNLKPWMVPMRSLSRILSAVQRLVDQRDDVEEDEEDENKSEAVVPDFTVLGGTRTLQLLKITSGSAKYAVSSINRESTLAILRETGESIKTPNDSQWHPSTISALDDLSQMASQLGVVIELRDPLKDGGGVIAKISQDTGEKVRNGAFKVGHTSVYGELVGVGGATEMRCRVRVRGRHRLLYCRVASSELISEMGKYIYQDVLLSGDAVWYRFNNQMKSLRVNSFSPAKVESLDEVSKRVREIAGDPWSKVADAEAYVREMRG